MAERKIDYFGTFLDSLRRERGLTQDPAKDLLKALRGRGQLAASALIPIVGNLTDFLALSQQLIDRGWVQKVDGDVYALTDKGREIAAVLE